MLGELGIDISPARLKCALLSRKVLKVGAYGLAGESFEEGGIAAVSEHKTTTESGFRDLKPDEIESLIESGECVEWVPFRVSIYCWSPVSWSPSSGHFRL